MAKLKCFVGRQRRDGTVNVEITEDYVISVPAEKVEITSRGVVRRGLLECQTTLQYDPNEMSGRVRPISWEIVIPTACGSEKLWVLEKQLVWS